MQIRSQIPPPGIHSFFLVSWNLLPLLGMAWCSGKTSLATGFVYFLVGFFLYASSSLLFRRRKSFARLSIFLASGAWIFFCILQKHDGVPVSMMWDILRGSNLHEATEYLASNHLWPAILMLGLGIWLGLYCCNNLDDDAIGNTWRKNVLAGALLSIAVSLHWDTLPWDAPPFPSPFSDAGASEIYPVGLAKLAVAGFHKSIRKESGKTPFHARREAVPPMAETHILIIGETSRYDRWHINGYVRPTSPFLDALPKEALLSFSKAHSPANLTINSVPIILSGMRPVDYAPEKIRHNWLDLMKESGFMTAWLSNQSLDPWQESRGEADFVIERLNNLVTVKFLFERLPYDGELLPILQRVVRYSPQRKFIVLHTSGSHMNYEYRRPLAFKRFSSAEDHLYPADKEPSMQDEYDNSILYTDWFIKQVIDQVSNLPGLASVTYISDHGERMLEEDGRKGHGSWNSSTGEQHVPLFIWSNLEFRQHYSAKWESLSSNQPKHVGGEDLLHTWADLLDIRFPEARYTSSFARKTYQPDLTTRVLAAERRPVPLNIP